METIKFVDFIHNPKHCIVDMDGIYYIPSNVLRNMIVHECKLINRNKCIEALLDLTRLSLFL